MRDYIEKDIQFQFQQFAIERNLVDLSDVERVSAADRVQILDYLRLDKTPLAGQIRYASLLAQHHGVPTRLLDWTASLDVAIGFAVSGASDSTARIVVWVIKQWDNKVRSADPDCDEQRLHGSFTETGRESVRLLIETSIHGSCLRLFSPSNDYMNEMHVMQPPSIGSGDDMQDARRYRVQLDNAHEVYVNDQKGNAMIDLSHDRHLYRNSYSQSLDARLSESPIPKDRVYKFTLSHSEIPWLLPLCGDFSVRWTYDLSVYAQFDDDAQPGGLSVEEKRRIREHNFLSMLGQRINTEIDWDSIDM